MSDMNIEILSTQGKRATKAELPAAIFGAGVNVPLIHQVVVAQQAAARQGTHATKTRGQVSGGGAKPWRQKGTGRARHGSRRAPQWTGGGTVFGPQPRSYAQRTPKKMIAAALCSVLSDRVNDKQLFVLDTIIKSDTPSTRTALEALSVIGDYRSAVVVLHRDEDVAWLSLRNVPNVHALAVDQLNVYDVVANQAVVFTRGALEEFIARFAGADLIITEEPDETDEAEAETKPSKPAKAKAEKPAEAEEAEETNEEPAGDKPAKAEPAKEENAAKEEKADKPAKAEKAAAEDKAEKPAKQDKAEKPAKADKAEKPAKAEKPEKADEDAKAEKPAKAAKPAKDKTDEEADK